MVIETPFEFWISTPFDEYINMSIIYQFYKAFINLEIKVVLISCSLSKVASKAVENNSLMALMTPTQPPAEQYPGGSGELSKQMKATHDTGS